MIRRHGMLGIAMVGLLACATSGPPGSALYRREIGNASGPDLVNRSLLIVRRYQYEVVDQDSLPFFRIETHWRERSPFADEQALGITDAESRVIITARKRSESEFGVLYNVRMAVENRVLMAGGSGWNEAVNTEMFERYADEITQEFREELNYIGVRRLE